MRQKLLPIISVAPDTEEPGRRAECFGHRHGVILFKTVPVHGRGVVEPADATASFFTAEELLKHWGELRLQSGRRNFRRKVRQIAIISTEGSIVYLLEPIRKLFRLKPYKFISARSRFCRGGLWWRQLETAAAAGEA